MKAILMTRPGPVEVLEPADLPEPLIAHPTGIKVRLRAAGVNPVDTKLRRNGLLGAGPLPAVLGCDGAGEVVAVGAAVLDMGPELRRETSRALAGVVDGAGSVARAA